MKGSFLAYVRRSGPHRIAAEPREGTVDGLFRFPGASRDGSGALRFSGRVQIEAHGGILRVDLADPVLSMLPDGSGVLAFLDALRGERLDLVRLRRSTTAEGDEATFAAYLLEEGEPVFGESYPVGTAFDPVHVRPA